ncbi:MAG: hypothetical protein WDO24_07810 [Pseudomonadota bacterium]
MDGAVYYVNLAINGVVEGLIVGLLALAINLVFAVARFPNAAAGDVMTVGAYAGVGVQALGSHKPAAPGHRRDRARHGGVAAVLCRRVPKTRQPVAGRLAAGVGRHRLLRAQHADLVRRPEPCACSRSRSPAR